MKHLHLCAGYRSVVSCFVFLFVVLSRLAAAEPVEASNSLLKFYQASETIRRFIHSPSQQMLVCDSIPLDTMLHTGCKEMKETIMNDHWHDLVAAAAAAACRRLGTIAQCYTHACV